MKRSRPNGLQEAPTYYPTEEDFKDPVSYIRKIAPEGKKFGICRVVPPENWQPSFAIDTEVRFVSLLLVPLPAARGGGRATEARLTIYFFDVALSLQNSPTGA